MSGTFTIGVILFVFLSVVGIAASIWRERYQERAKAVERDEHEDESVG